MNQSAFFYFFRNLLESFQSERKSCSYTLIFINGFFEYSNENLRKAYKFGGTFHLSESSFSVTKRNPSRILFVEYPTKGLTQPRIYFYPTLSTNDKSISNDFYSKWHRTCISMSWKANEAPANHIMCCS